MDNSGVRVLVVEDDPGKLYVIARALRAQGFDVWEATTGAEGLARARELPDIMVLDVKLPDTSGFEIAKKIKGDPLTSSILILELTARYAAASDRVRGLDAGADGYLIHPVDANELVANVRSLLRLRRLERERATLASQVEAGERRYQTVTETTTVGLFQIDGDGRCTFMNRAAETITGHRFADARGKRLHDLLHPDHGEPKSGSGDVCPIAALPLGAENVREVRNFIERKDGARIPVRLTASPVATDDRSVAAVVEVKDDSALVRAEQARDLFLATLGHDLRGPLQTVSLVTNLLEESRTLSEKERGLLGRLTSSTTRMRRLIDHMLVFAQALVQGIPLQRHETNLAALCADVVRDLRLANPNRKIELEGPADLFGDWDSDRLIQVIDNLVGNALRHGEDPVRLTLTSLDRSALMIVHNAGKPIPSEALATLFDPFRRAGGDRAKGTGLGLYIVDSIVRAHGGTVEVTSSADQGTEFRVRLPLTTS